MLCSDAKHIGGSAKGATGCRSKRSITLDRVRVIGAGGTNGFLGLEAIPQATGSAGSVGQSRLRRSDVDPVGRMCPSDYLDVAHSFLMGPDFFLTPH